MMGFMEKERRTGLMTIKIYMLDGQVDFWHEKDYTDYCMNNDYFVVINSGNWVGMYNLSAVKKIVVKEGE